jgi:glycosidase
MRRGADGWRLDVPEEIKTEGFWEEFRTRVRRVNPEAYLVGEIWDPATGWINDLTRFDGVMNYQFAASVLRFAAAGRIDPNVVAPVNMTLEPPLGGLEYRRSLDRLFDLYPEDAHRANLNLLGSHDTARVLSMVGEDVTSVVLAQALVFTFPGAPCIYYGDEIGMAGLQDPGSRAAFPWDDPASWNYELLEAMKGLTALRRAHPALRRGGYRHLLAEGRVYAFAREEPGERLAVALNVGDHEVHPWARMEGTAAERVWGSGEASLGAGALHLALPARSAGVWKIS